MSNTQDLLARLARLESENAAKDARIAELSKIKAVDYAQVTGNFTIPKGQREDLEGKYFEATFKIRGKFGRSKLREEEGKRSGGNVSAHICTKVPLSSIVLLASAEAPTPVS